MSMSMSLHTIAKKSVTTDFKLVANVSKIVCDRFEIGRDQFYDHKLGYLTFITYLCTHTH